MPRITIDLRMYRHSGIGRYLRNLMPSLLPLLQADSVRVLGTPALLGDASWLGGPQRDQRIELFETSAPIYSLAELQLGLRGAFRDTQLLWVPHFNAPLFYRGPMAVTIHDIAPLALPEILGNALKRAYARLLIERATSQASAILCDSAFTADEVHRRVGTSRDKMTVVHLGLDEHWSDDLAPHHEVDGAPYLLYVGNVKPNKNLTLLLKAFAVVQDRLPHRLLLAGRMRGFGTTDDAVILQAEAMGDRVRFTDEISDEELIALYAGAEALVLPSLYEGFGLPLLEAMQMSCPVMSSNAASLPEIGGDAALYFDPHSVESLAETLLRVTDKPLMDTLRATGRRRAKEFSYARCAEQTAVVLNPLLGMSK